MTDSGSPRSLGSVFASALALTRRYDESFDVRDLDAAIDAWATVARCAGAEGVASARYDAWNNQAVLLVQRHLIEGRDTDLDQALDGWERALGLVERGTDSDIVSLSNYGGGLRMRYERDGSRSDLVRLLEVFEEVAARTLQGDPELPGRLSNLGVGLETRYDRDGRLEDLTRALRLFAEAVTAASPSDPERPGYLSNFARASTTEYVRTGDPGDLDRAVAAYQEAVATGPAQHPERSDYLAGLGTALRLQYERTGDGDTLQASIRAYEVALDAASAGALRRGDVLDGLGTALRNRYYRTGNLDDLDRAVSAYAAALAHTSAEAPSIAVHLQNLGLALQDRHARTGQPADLATAVAAHTDSVQRSPGNAPERAGRLGNLANSLLTRFMQEGNPDDLDAAGATAEEAIAVAQAEGAALLHGTRGAAHMHRYWLHHDQTDLDTAALAFVTALEGLPADSPRAVVFRHNLAVALRWRAALTGTSEDRRRAGEEHRRTVREGKALWPEWALMAARSWGAWAVTGRAWAEAAEAYTAATAALHVLVAAQLRRDYQERWLAEVQLLPDRAAEANVHAGDLRGAALLLEQGRALLLAEQLRNDLADLDGLVATGRPDLADRYRVATGRWRDLQTRPDVAQASMASVAVAASG